jgi:hypothetical protein
VWKLSQQDPCWAKGPIVIDCSSLVSHFNGYFGMSATSNPRRIIEFPSLAVRHGARKPPRPAVFSFGSLGSQSLDQRKCPKLGISQYISIIRWYLPKTWLTQYQIWIKVWHDWYWHHPLDTYWDLDGLSDRIHYKNSQTWEKIMVKLSWTMINTSPWQRSNYDPTEGSPTSSCPIVG